VRGGHGFHFVLTGGVMLFVLVMLGGSDFRNVPHEKYPRPPLLLVNDRALIT